MYLVQYIPPERLTVWQFQVVGSGSPYQCKGAWQTQLGTNRIENSLTEWNKRAGNKKKMAVILLTASSNFCISSAAFVKSDWSLKIALLLGSRSITCTLSGCLVGEV